MFLLSQLRCFIAVAEERHFGRAAERLDMTQPPLSRQIQQLEKDLGVALLERSNRLIALTAAGRSFLNDAKRIVRLAEEAHLSARRVAGGEGGTLTIGFIPAASYALIPRIVSMTNHAMPGVEVILKEMVTADQIESLYARRIDIGLLRLPVDRERIEAVCISRDPLVLAVPEDHPFSLMSTVNVGKLDLQPFVMYAPVESRYHHDLVSNLFARADINPRYVQYAREAHTILALVGAGLGLAIVPASAARLRPPNVSIRRLDLTVSIFSELSLAWLKQKDNPAVSAFCQVVHSSLLTL